MNDDAVAPVIAVMLILAAVVTFLVVWNGIYVPSMKQGAEVGHLQNVESAFLHFSSDIERAVSARQNLSLSEPVQLGGGDFFFNTLKSGGSLSVTEETVPPYTLALYKELDPHPVMAMKGTLVNISYEPVGNFWQDQGYRWQYGYLNVTKYRTKQTPLGYYNMTGVSNEFEGSGSLAIFAGSFGDVQYTLNQTLFPDKDINGTIISYSPRAGNCASVALRAVNLTASPDHSFASGNGFGKLELKSTVTSVPCPGVSLIVLSSDGRPFGTAAFNRWNTSLAEIDGNCENIQYAGDSGLYRMYRIYQTDDPVNVMLDIVNIEIGAY